MDIDGWSIRQDYNGNNTRDFAVYDKTAAALRLYLDTSGRFGVGSSTSLTSTFTVGGTMTASGITTLTSTTATTSTTTGALVVSGGVGIKSNAFIGGNVVISSGLASSSSTTGALVVTGGVGISGALNIGGALTTGSQISTTYTAAKIASATNLGTGAAIFTSVSGSNIQLRGIKISKSGTIPSGSGYQYFISDISVSATSSGDDVNIVITPTWGATVDHPASPSSP
jgi:hypothetical protein